MTTFSRSGRRQIDTLEEGSSRVKDRVLTAGEPFRYRLRNAGSAPLCLSRSPRQGDNCGRGLLVELLQLL